MRKPNSLNNLSRAIALKSFKAGITQLDAVAEERDMLTKREAAMPETEISTRMVRAGAEVIWRAFDDPSHSSFGEHVARLVYQAMETSRDL